MVEASDETEVGRGVRCYDCYDVTIVNNKFKQLHGKRGGAVYLENCRSSRIFSNEFLECSAEQGGGLYLYHSEVSVRQNRFRENKAIANGHFERNPGKDHEGAGAAIFFTCVNLQDSNSYYNPREHYDYLGNHMYSDAYLDNPTCDVDIADNEFEFNEAEGKGGALMYTNANFTDSG